MFFFFQFQCRVLLNLRTTQPFEEVIEDLGHVLKMNNAKRMLTVSNQEVTYDGTNVFILFNLVSYHI